MEILANIDAMELAIDHATSSSVSPRTANGTVYCCRQGGLGALVEEETRANRSPPQAWKPK